MCVLGVLLLASMFQCFIFRISPSHKSSSLPQITFSAKRDKSTVLTPSSTVAVKNNVICYLKLAD